MSKNKSESGPFEAILSVVGFITGGMIGYEQGELGGAIAGALLLAVVGNRVGAMADWVIKVVVLIAFLLLNAAIRQFIWGFIRSVLDGA